jgi:antitoxin component HigA of HigAB toxin-antitoxin module
MIDAKEIVKLQEEATLAWHEPAAVPAAASEVDALVVEQGLDALVLEQHRANFDLWHEEDQARDPQATPEKIVAIKRAIDRLNQRRNDLVERIDRMLLEEAGEQRAEAPLHSETPGMMIDRLSILELKRFHTEEEIARRADEQHAERNQQRLVVLKEQRDDLRDALDDLWAEVMSGKRRFKLYRQLKMYNDPALNPVLYRGRAAK